MGAASRTRVQRRPVHGVLLLDKPLGLSSNQALQKAKWLLRAEKAGHTGTLDPLATGVLPLCFGAATKFSGLHLDADKHYEALLQLGQRTSTGDAEGQVVAEQAVPRLDADVLAFVRQRFVGPQQQLPPMHSALKKDGKALYEYARAGIEVERQPRAIVVHALALTPEPGQAKVLRLQVHCSKGTYIRTLGEDIAAALGTVGHLVALRRTATDPFQAAQCIGLDALEALDEPARLACLQPPEALLSEHVRIVLPNDEAGRFLTGMRRRGPWPDAPRVAVYGDSPRALLGTGHVKAGELVPGRLLSPLELQQMLNQTKPAAG